MDNSRIILYENGCTTQGPNYAKEKSIKQIWIIRLKAHALPVVSETIFRDGNGGKSKNLKVKVQGPSAASGGGQGATPPEAESFF